jgi:hypothetical protein
VVRIPSKIAKRVKAPAKNAAPPAVATTAALPDAKKLRMDPQNVNARLYRQLTILLDQMERQELTMTFSQRLSALIAVGRIQIMFMSLRKEGKDDDAGTAARAAAEAFRANAAGRRTAVPRSNRRDSAADASLLAAISGDEDDDESA